MSEKSKTWVTVISWIVMFAVAVTGWSVTAFRDVNSQVSLEMADKIKNITIENKALRDYFTFEMKCVYGELKTMSGDVRELKTSFIYMTKMIEQRMGR